ncbi:class I SAM-dependent DNA methyltransferase [Myroides pelagicus]|uniref:Methyltransferase domain-containing protein n=1 Tax=Myroides pelagicus TaxID=270914 RepID=A0A7K1GME3_9FLAO|nr:class I SAM-dependent methyltransferase [Myroides pelagicus]MEC4113582.1 class I SAM-dependent methyltransferase [Myroides pelagicus]MTH30026.1 methyltransferase domain-containing protein [Myroides pelagicus]
MSKESKAWYASWFDTEYYHTLYKDRDYEEAQLLIDNLSHYLNLSENAKVLDLACGKGRHSIYLNQLGYNVTGVDLSENSINTAKKYENDTLHFEVHDMREELTEKYDAILNLFTSFGYFADEADNAKALKAIHNSLNEYGLAVVDFMNVDKVIDNLVAEETKNVDGITFNIKRKYENGFIVKNIQFQADGQQHDYTEKVKALRLEDFEKMMNDNDIYLLDVFGDYKLRKFYKKESDRLIMIFK